MFPDNTTNTTVGFPPLPHIGNTTNSFNETAAMAFSLTVLAIFFASMTGYLGYSNRHAISNTCSSVKNCVAALSRYSITACSSAKKCVSGLFCSQTNEDESLFAPPHHV